MCKIHLNSYKTGSFPSTTACGKLVENHSALRITFTTTSFPPLSTGTFNPTLRKCG